MGGFLQLIFVAVFDLLRWLLMPKTAHLSFSRRKANGSFGQSLSFQVTHLPRKKRRALSQQHGLAIFCFKIDSHKKLFWENITLTKSFVSVESVFALVHLKMTWTNPLGKLREGCVDMRQ